MRNKAQLSISKPFRFDTLAPLSNLSTVTKMRRKPPAIRRTRIKAAHEVIEGALQHAAEAAAKEGLGRQAAQTAIAAKLGVSTSLLYKWRESTEGGSGQTNPLERTVQLLEATGDKRILEWLCQKSGGSFIVENPLSEPDLNRAANALVRKFSLLIAELSEATEDQVIDPEESRRLRASWNKLREHCEAFVRTCESGDYSPQK
jgi:transposase